MPDTRVTPASFSNGFVHKAEHDLRACFRAGKTVPDWIEEDLAAAHATVPDSILELLDMLRVQAARGDRLVVDLCAYVTAGREALSPERIDCADLLRRSAAQLPDGWDVAIDCACDFATADGKALQRVLDVMVSNAVTHHDSPPGGLWLAARGCSAAVAISVEDDGPGLAPAQRDRVFEPLTTLKSRDEREGSGLGLAIARRLVTAMGGEIKAEARRGLRGTRITARLPR